MTRLVENFDILKLHKLLSSNIIIFYRLLTENKNGISCLWHVKK